MKIILLLITFIYILFENTSSLDIESTFMTNKEFYRLIEELSQNSIANSQIKLMFLKIKKNKKKIDNETLRRVLKEFMLTIGVDVNEIINWDNKHFVAILSIQDQIDRNLLLEQFSDVIENLSEKLPREIKNEL